MQLGRIPKAYRGLRRVRRIVKVFAHYGFWDVVERLGIATRFEKFSRIFRKTPPRAFGRTTAERFRLALEELGPAFIKFGQFLSVRSDILPEEWTQELEKLQDQVHPLPLEDILPSLQKELGRKWDEFHSIEPHPIGSASLAQVHVAQLKNGTRLALKIQRPGIVRQITTDLDILTFLAGLLHEYIDEIRPFDVPYLVTTFRRSLLKELDFLIEAQQIHRFSVNNTDENIVLPEVMWRYCTPRLLATSTLEGTRLDDMSSTFNERKECARKLAHFVFTMIFHHGFFHADPHPGNFLITPDGRIGLVDFGLVGNLPSFTRHTILNLIASALREDYESLARGLIRLGVLRQPPPLEFYQDLQDMISRYTYLSREKVFLHTLFEELYAFFRRYSLRLPHDLALLMKTIHGLDSIIQKLDPEFYALNILKPIIEPLLLREKNPFRKPIQIYNSIDDLLALFESSRTNLEWTVQSILRGNWHIPMRIHRMEEYSETFQRGVNRLSVTLFLTGLMIASTLMLSSHLPPLWHGISLPGLTGWIITLTIGSYVGFRFLRTRL